MAGVPLSGPGPLSRAVRFGRDPLGFLDGLRGGTGDGPVRARFVTGPSLWFLADPTLVERVLVDETDRYWRPDILSSRTEALTDDGLIQSDGARWERQRARLRPLFGVDRLAGYADTIVATADEVVGEWADGASVDLYRETAEITLRVIAAELLGIAPSPAEVARIRTTSAAVAREFTVSPATLVRQLLPTPPSRAYRRAVTDTKGWADAVIDERRRRVGGRGDDDPDTLLGVMLAAERDPDTAVDHALIRDELLTFLFAGYETTALTLSFALWYVSRRPALASALREEARAASTGGGLGWRSLPELELARRVVRETLRLRPASWGLFREARTDTRLGGTRIAAGDFLMCPQWTLHRDARYFDDPEAFDPDRWRDRDPNGVAAYFPFGAGPQSCIGGRLARTEATLVVARVAREVDLTTRTRAVDHLRPAGVLLPRDGVPATVRRP